MHSYVHGVTSAQKIVTAYRHHHDMLQSYF